MGGDEVQGGIFGLRFKRVAIVGKGTPATILALTLLIVVMTGLPLLFFQSPVWMLAGMFCSGLIALVAIDRILRSPLAKTRD